VYFVPSQLLCSVSGLFRREINKPENRGDVFLKIVVNESIEHFKEFIHWVVRRDLTHLADKSREAKGDFFTLFSLFNLGGKYECQLFMNSVMDTLQNRCLGMNAKDLENSLFWIYAHNRKVVPEPDSQIVRFTMAMLFWLVFETKEISLSQANEILRYSNQENLPFLELQREVYDQGRKMTCPAQRGSEAFPENYFHTKIEIEVPILPSTPKQVVPRNSKR